ncbi:rRNA maturation RNase YbeY [Paratissierella segnis]|jgi:probable rRNA maturation factor|uniref:Endoribonuclease YbeY n=1 Tax=Paratissierella segnis TaxID=2763679 RepID=A0A926IKK1_9FIRM|nr:rRNA maturation RNase YbeY [Paratissierella segnis]MBC8588375.1 rRNA maturation RNase YbeY [Paratissierella segnis]
MNIYIDNRQEKFDISEEINKHVKTAIIESLKVEGLKDNYEVSVSYVDNYEIKKLNREYRGIDRETDVLSFPFNEVVDIPVLILGDIIISVEKAYEQSIDYGHSLDREIVYLTVHSMFHLMGYDHLKDEEKEIMRNKEKRVMKNLKVFKSSS